MKHDDPLLDRPEQTIGALKHRYAALRAAYTRTDTQAAEHLHRLRTRAAAEAEAEAGTAVQDRPAGVAPGRRAPRRRPDTGPVFGYSPILGMLAAMLKLAASVPLLSNSLMLAVAGTLTALTIAGRLSVEVAAPLATVATVLFGLRGELPNRIERNRDKPRTKKNP